MSKKTVKITDVAQNLENIIELATAALEAVRNGSADEATPTFDLDKLDSMKLADLKKVAKDAGIEGADKMKEKALREAIAEFYADDSEEEGDEDEDEGEDEVPTYTEKQLKKMDEDALTEHCEELEIEPVTSGKGKNKKFDKDATIAAILEAYESGEEDEEEDEDGDEDGEEGLSQEDLEEMDDDTLIEAAEEAGVEPTYKGKGKSKKLDRDATIESILEASEGDEDGEDDEEESDEDGLSTYEEDDLDELDEDELKAHLEELAANAEDYEFEMPKGWKKLSGKAKLKKAILEVYAQLEEDEE